MGNGSIVRVTDLCPLKLLHNAPTAGLVKLLCSIGGSDDRQQWAKAAG
jgi:hypothetical protein